VWADRWALAWRILGVALAFMVFTFVAGAVAYKCKCFGPRSAGQRGGDVNARQWQRLAEEEKEDRLESALWPGIDEAADDSMEDVQAARAQKLCDRWRTFNSMLLTVQTPPRQHSPRHKVGKPNG